MAVHSPKLAPSALTAVEATPEYGQQFRGRRGRVSWPEADPGPEGRGHPAAQTTGGRPAQGQETGETRHLLWLQGKLPPGCLSGRLHLQPTAISSHDFLVHVAL